MYEDSSHQPRSRAAGNGSSAKADRQRPDQGDRTGTPRAVQPAQAGQVRWALAQLGPAQRAVLQEVYYRRRSAPEAAAALDMPVVVVKSCLRQALHDLHEHLADAVGGEAA